MYVIEIKGITARCTNRDWGSEMEQAVTSVQLYMKMLLHDLLSAWLTGILFRSQYSQQSLCWQLDVGQK